MSETMKLRQQVADLQAKLGRIMEGLEGACMTCEPVGVRNQQMEQHIAELKQQIKKLRSERNLARREVCNSRASCIQGKSPLDIAEALGWDCFHVDKGHKADPATEQTSHRPDRIAVERSDVTS
jgi:hypothetical protein